MTEIISSIPSRIKNITIGGHVCGAEDIIDDVLQMGQDEINQRIINFLNNPDSQGGGKSAYQIAVDNGYNGTEQDWIESLKGNDGKSAYQIAVYNGYQGTEVEWLNSLKGRDAEQNNFDPLILNPYATKSYVDQKLAEVIGDTPQAVEALTQLAEILNNDQSVISDIAEAINGKADKDKVYSKTESDQRYLREHQDISGKANITDVYNKDAVYTKYEIDSKIGNLGNRIEADPQNNVEAEPHTVKSYISQEINKITGLSPEILDTINNIKNELNDNSVASEILSQLNNKVNTDNVYSKATVDNMIGAVQQDLNAFKNRVNQALDNLTNLIQQQANNEKTKHIFLTQEMYDSLESYDNNAIYFILNGTVPQNNGFTYTFPLTLG